MTNIIDKLVAIPADKLDDAETWIGTHCGREKVVMPIPVQACARIVFRTKGNGFIWRCGSDSSWPRDGSRAVAVHSEDLDRVQMLVDEARDVLTRHDIEARLTHWLVLKCEFVGAASADGFAQSIGGIVIASGQD